MIITFLLNSLWMALAVALLCACVDRARVHPLIREYAWTLGLLLAVAAPLATLASHSAPSLHAFRFAATVSVPAAPGRFDWIQAIAIAYAIVVALAALRLLWGWAQLRRLNEDTI